MACYKRSTEAIQFEELFDQSLEFPLDKLEKELAGKMLARVVGAGLAAEPVPDSNASGWRAR